MSDLRSQTLDVAMGFVSEGHLDFSMRELASKLGVSHMAPYKQFASKEALLAEVASQGFTLLKEDMYKAKTAKSNEEYFTKMGLAYINFAEQNPYLYRLMFSEAIQDHSRFETLQESGHSCFSTLVEMIMSFQRSRYIIEGNPLTIAFSVWSMVHGFSMILSQNKVDNMKKNENLKQFSSEPLKKWEKNLKSEMIKSSLRSIKLNNN